jgi:hypothetical protein
MMMSNYFQDTAYTCHPERSRGTPRMFVVTMQRQGRSHQYVVEPNLECHAGRVLGMTAIGEVRRLRLIESIRHLGPRLG